jgi:4'-phosphopantetheinyl transferase
VPGTTDLWYYLYQRNQDEGLIAAERDLLAPDELRRLERLRFGRGRRMFIATRALVRTVLSSYADVAPKDWRFESDDHGKPHVVEPATGSSISFNLTNTRGLVVCAVSTAHSLVGVDAERLDRKVETVRLADRFFSPAEARDLRQHQPYEQQERFFQYWTLKESYIKARGLGLALPLDKFSFRLDERSIRIDIDEELGDDETCWRFTLLELAPTYLIAVGVNTGGNDLSLRASPRVPLEG